MTDKIVTEKDIERLLESQLTGLRDWYASLKAVGIAVEHHEGQLNLFGEGEYSG